MLETIVVLMVVSENIFNLSEIEDEKTLFNYKGWLDIYETIRDRNMDKTMD